MAGLRPSLTIATLCLMAPPAYTAECVHPVYRGLETGAILRFVNEKGPDDFGESGTIETVSPHQLFKFTTEYSNGFSREYISLKGMPKGSDVSSVVMRKDTNFKSVDGPAAFLITPDLPSGYYYATNRQGQEALHAVQLDDTWKRIACYQK